MTGRPRPVRPAEVEGFLEGVRHRLKRRREAGTPDVDAERLFEEAQAATRRGDWPLAEERLHAADARLDAAEPERALSEWPRGLVGYVPRGEVGVPPEREEEPIANRLLLVHRLLEVRRSEGWNVEALYRLLAAAEEAYRAGDRARARALGDEVHRRLEGPAPEP